MTDIVRILRDGACYENIPKSNLLKAANSIERLRKDKQRLRQKLKQFDSYRQSLPDIVQRLLADPPKGKKVDPLYVEAADEIQRLQFWLDEHQLKNSTAHAVLSDKIMEINRLTAVLREIRCTCDEHCNPSKSGCDHWLAHEALGFED